METIQSFEILTYDIPTTEMSRKAAATSNSLASFSGWQPNFEFNWHNAVGSLMAKRRSNLKRKRQYILYWNRTIKTSSNNDWS